MKILHAAEEIAGVPATLAKYQRLRGHEVTTLSYHPSAYGISSDVSYPGWPRLSKRLKLNRMIQATRELLPRYDVIHLSGGRTLLPLMLDLPLAKRLGKVVIVHFHGCDIKQAGRVRGVEGVHCYECALRPTCSTSMQLVRLRMARRYADAILCSTPDLLAVVPEAKYLPNPIDLESWSKALPGPRPAESRFTVMHRPTAADLKGTAHVSRALAELIGEGLDIEAAMGTHHVPHDEMSREYGRADLVVDQLYFGWYGMTAIEAMAAGRPVIAWLRRGLRETNGDPPVIQADRYNLKDCIRKAYEDRSTLTRVAKAGVAFVREVHDVRIVGEAVLKLYSEVGGG